MKDTIITGEANIRAAQALSRYSALGLEALGLTRRGRSCLSIVRAEHRLTARTAKKALVEYGDMLREAGILGEASILREAGILRKAGIFREAGILKAGILNTKANRGA